MDDLISRKWLLECIEQGWIKFDTEKDKNKFIHLVRDTAPSVDAVEVVRCKDCKYWDIFDIHSTICPDNRRCKGIIGKMYTPPDYYCAYGERKDD